MGQSLASRYYTIRYDRRD